MLLGLPVRHRCRCVKCAPIQIILRNFRHFIKLYTPPPYIYVCVHICTLVVAPNFLSNFLVRTVILEIAWASSLAGKIRKPEAKFFCTLILKMSFSPKKIKKLKRMLRQGVWAVTWLFNFIGSSETEEYRMMLNTVQISNEFIRFLL